MKLLIMQFSRRPVVTYCLLGPDIFLSVLFLSVSTSLPFYVGRKYCGIVRSQENASAGYPVLLTK
jgi:hypothetical protein